MGTYDRGLTYCPNYRRNYPVRRHVLRASLKHFLMCTYLNIFKDRQVCWKPLYCMNLFFLVFRMSGHRLAIHHLYLFLCLNLYLAWIVEYGFKVPNTDYNRREYSEYRIEEIVIVVSYLRNVRRSRISRYSTFPNSEKSLRSRLVCTIINVQLHHSLSNSGSCIV